jgi:hypothetical protein
VQVRIFFLPPATPTRAVSGRSRPRRAGSLLGLAGVGRLRRLTLF